MLWWPPWGPRGVQSLGEEPEGKNTFSLIIISRTSEQISYDRDHPMQSLRQRWSYFILNTKSWCFELEIDIDMVPWGCYWLVLSKPIWTSYEVFFSVNRYYTLISVVQHNVLFKDHSRITLRHIDPLTKRKRFNTVKIIVST